jgi:glycosyltransferase involved in cell wall biosynthesis
MEACQAISENSGNDRSRGYEPFACRQISNAPPTPPVSICIPVKDEEQNLPFCLASVVCFSEVIVVDSQSSDSTVSIAERANAKVLQFHWNGRFPKKRNWVLRSYQFANPWVLFLDADERVTPEFVSEMTSLLPNTSHSGFWISFDNHFMGARLRYGDSFRKLALFRIGSGEFEQVPDDQWSDLDMEVHEHPILRGTTGTIHARLQHWNQNTLAAYIKRHEKYSSWEAKRYLCLQNAGAKSWQALNRRQRFKYHYLNRFWFPYFYFALQFVLKGGFRDGHPGLLFALLKLDYFRDIRRKIRIAAGDKSIWPISLRSPRAKSAINLGDDRGGSF